MAEKLIWFTIRLALTGISPAQAFEVVQDLQDELNARHHLRNPHVFWEDQTQEVIVEVDNQGLRSKSAAEGMSEELLEATVAVVRKFERIHIEVLDVKQS